MTVINFAQAKAEREPHWEGPVKCLGCHHEWHAAAPVGTMFVDCPSCGLPKGTPKHPFGASEGDSLFVCNVCDGEALTAYYRKGKFRIMCMGCGTDHTEAVLA